MRCEHCHSTRADILGSTQHHWDKKQIKKSSCEDDQRMSTRSYWKYSNKPDIPYRSTAPLLLCGPHITLMDSLKRIRLWQSSAMKALILLGPLARTLLKSVAPLCRKRRQNRETISYIIVI